MAFDKPRLYRNFISSGVPPKPALSNKCLALFISQSWLVIGSILPYQFGFSFAEILKEKRNKNTKINNLIFLIFNQINFIKQSFVILQYNLS